MMGDSATVESAGRANIIDIWRVAGSGPIRSVLICDDRPCIIEGLVGMLRPLPALVDVAWVTDGFALVDAVAAGPADLVLIGVHRASTVGADAASLLLGMHPAAVVIVFGSPADIDVLAATYIRGACGLLLWDADQPSPWASGTSEDRLTR